MLMKRSRKKQRMSGTKSMLVKQCPLCWGLFSTRSKHRRFCCPKHTTLWHQYQHLLKKKSRSKLRDWELGLLERLERFIERERITNSEVIKNLRGYDAPQANGGEVKC